MRLALVGNWPRPYGGVAVHVAALARAARARGVDVRVLDIGRGDHSGDGVRPARGALRYAAALGGAAAEGRLLHVHTSGANVKSWLVALAASRARRGAAPLGVLTLHSGSAPAWLRGGPARRALAAAACAGFGRILAVNDEIAAALGASGVPRARIAVVPPYSPALLEPRRPPPGLAAFRTSHVPLLAAALPPGRIYGADLLLPAFRALRARHPRAGLVAFGEGTEALTGDAVLGLGELDHPAALAVLEAADVFARPTRADGDAVTVREALALGRAVVASTVGHRPAGCLLFPPGDAAALAARLEDAVAGAPPAARPRDDDPFDAIFAVYRVLWTRARGAPAEAAAPAR
ncbi:glycosyltransferase [Anaeromyxobacter dehalogenans]|uniref:Glycosyltransferase-like protein n=1 Tax=Anaeromyxobacter dehalogenans (strain 2CP-C) TaxID=290397 RepID=Q2ILK4_ANADE|nr:glycosyltransferase [Anaeromyxobacter dehalogenans]ABC82532.1 glycosyltransferase-like protein [Anaeromyxobacter dehalogenans 2CP-C]